LRLEQAGESVFIFDAQMLLARATGSDLQTGPAIRAGLPTCDTLQSWRDTPRRHWNSFTFRGTFGGASDVWLSADIPRSDGLHGALYRWTSGQWHLVREQPLPYWSYDQVARWSGERWVALVSRTDVCMAGNCVPGPDDVCRMPKRDPCEGKPKRSDHHFEIVAGPPKPLPTPKSVSASPICSKVLWASKLASFASGEIFSFGSACSTSDTLCERWTAQGKRLQETLFAERESGFLGLAARTPSDIVLATRTELTRFNGTNWRVVPLPQSRLSISSMALDPDGSLWLAGFAVDAGMIFRQQPNGDWQSLTVPRTTTVDATQASYLPEALGFAGRDDGWLLARHPNCALISGGCRYGIFHFGPTQVRGNRPVQRIEPVCKDVAEPEAPLTAATAACANVFVRLSGPRRASPTDQYLAIRSVLRGHPEFAGATFGTFHPFGGEWFGAAGLSYPLAQQLVALVSQKLPHLGPVASCETPTLGERMRIDFATGSVLSVESFPKLEKSYSDFP
jgi:hypothetical protein